MASRRAKWVPSKKELDRHSRQVWASLQVQPRPKRFVRLPEFEQSVYAEVDGFPETRPMARVFVRVSWWKRLLRRLLARLSR